MKFFDRSDAGEQLADVIELETTLNTVVLALPRGGIPLGLIIVDRFHVPFDVAMSKKIGHPSHSEYAIGAVSEEGEPILNTTEVTGLNNEWLENEVNAIRRKMESRRQQYSAYLEKIPIKNKTVVIVDDGIATGMTMKAAIQSAYSLEAKKVIVAVPVIPKDTYEELKQLADEVVAVEVPRAFLGAVGAYYRHFPQIEDDQVLELLENYQKKNKP
ncbi:phosphoribosyltransferase family protein [Alkalibacterium iburiense]|uniref:Phosphoribosyltransferase family protein n=1 Tax=Alkalibacterium iburiense TaxID=290589 RepID=A0ABN0X7F2_9LACT